MLTKAQKKLIEEIKEITGLLHLDYEDILTFEKEARLPILRSIKDQYIRSEIIMKYTLIDELLNHIIVDYFLRDRKTTTKSGKTKKVQNFSHYILEKIYLLNKLDLVKNIIKLPRDIESGIRAINDLRNGLAHSFFPEKTRRNKPIYKGRDIYDLEGLKFYLEDAKKISDFLFKKAFKIDISNMDFRI